MTVTTSTSVAIYRGNGATTNWPFNFPVLSATDLVVQRRVFATGTIDLTYDPSAYTISGLLNPAGGSVALTPALSSDYEIIISRVVPYVQLLNLANQAGFFPDSIEQQLDLMVMQIQQVANAFASLAPSAGSPNTLTLTASEPLFAGAWINIHDVAAAQLATAVGKACHGFVLAATVTGAQAVVSLNGLNWGAALVGSEVNAYLSDTVPGGHRTTGIDATDVANIGKISQLLGPVIPGFGVFFTPNSGFVI